MAYETETEHIPAEERHKTSSLRAIGNSVLALGLLVALLALISFGFTPKEYDTGFSFHWQGLIYSLLIFIPTLFSWGVLKGLADIRDEIRGSANPE